MELGKFHMSLTVKNLEDSKIFYQKLGFEVIDGTVEKNWLIMQNQDTYIGLFQDMFPKNTLTFLPKDARALQEQIKNEDIEIKVQVKPGDGPAAFMIEDPDGNPILFDQR